MPVIAAPAEPSAHIVSTDRMQTAGLKVFDHQYHRMRKHEPGTRIGADPEVLHDMRVASRRIRAAMRVFGAAFGQRLIGFRRDVPYITRALGGVRDADVFFERLEHTTQSVPELTLEDFAPLTKWLRLRREIARKRMLKEFDGNRYTQLCQRFEAFLERGSSARPRLPLALLTVEQAAPRIVRERLRKVLRFGRPVAATPTEKQLHALRIHCKQLRYTMEFFAPAYGDELSTFILSVKELQDILGAHQDAVVAQRMLRLFASEAPARKLVAHTLVAVGELIAFERGTALSLREGFHQSWKQFDKRRRRRALYQELGFS